MVKEKIDNKEKNQKKEDENPNQKKQIDEDPEQKEQPNEDPFDYDVLLEERYIFNKDIVKALEIVKEFIISKKLILAGGTGLDYLLKLKGNPGIYDPKRLPDFDFYSPNHLEDSCELANELQRLGYNNMTNINAVHATTRRVRVNFFPVADITYVPENIFTLIPVIKLKSGMLVRGPEMIRIDMHRSLCMPYENVPREVILHRWKKDIERFNLLVESYPIEGMTKLYKNPKSENSVDIKVYPSFHKDNLVSGYVAYNILVKAYYTVCSLMNETPQVSDIKLELNKKQVPKYSKKKISNHNKTNENVSIKTTIPIDEICLISNESYKTSLEIRDKLIKKYKKNKNKLSKDSRINQKENLIPKFYNTFLDNKPRSISVDNYSIYDNRFNLLSYTRYKDINIVSYHYICIYFLYKYIKTKDLIHLDYYRQLLVMIEHVSIMSNKLYELLSTTKETKNESQRPKKIPIDEIKLFSLSLSVYGTKNISHSRLKYLLDLYAIYKPNDKTVIINNLVPKNQYPKQTEGCPEFESEHSIFFDIDDEEVPDFKNEEMLYNLLNIG